MKIENQENSSLNLELLEKQIKPKKQKKDDSELLGEIEKQYVDFVSQYKLSYNALTNTIHIDNKPLDLDTENKIKNKAYSIIKRLNTDRLFCKIHAMALEKSFNPIIDFVHTLPKWDKKDRISQLASCFTVIEDVPNFSFRRKLEYFLSKAIKRWSTNEHAICLVFSGNQGIGKSTFFRWLCPLPDYFIEKEVSPESKDDRFLLCHSMLWEITELASTTRKKDVDSLKAFLSCEVIDDRKAYTKSNIRKPCKAVFCATVNDVGGFLVDVENRRFLVSKIAQINLEYNQIDKLQLFSQAKECYLNGKADLTFEEKQVQADENIKAQMDNVIEIAIKNFFEITKNESDTLPAYTILETLIDSKISIRGNELSKALINLGVTRKRMTKGIIYLGIKNKINSDSID